MYMLADFSEGDELRAAGMGIALRDEPSALPHRCEKCKTARLQARAHRIEILRLWHYAKILTICLTLISMALLIALVIIAAR
jgi:hypothetical protein